jgi:hypothetical protein
MDPTAINYNPLVTCDDGSCVFPTAVNEVISELLIYPNPASEEFFIKLNSFNLYNIEIIDVLGRLLISKESVKGLIAIKTAEFSNGTYLIRIQDDSDIQTYKIVIDR